MSHLSPAEPTMEISIPQQSRVIVPSTTPGTIGMTGKRFECNAPGCGRQFTRKEHLTRHAKSHTSRPQHQCPICGRRYVRSDVLKRHIEFHPQLSNLNQGQGACVSCHKRKLKCDEATPCQSCISYGHQCVRSHTSPVQGASYTSTTADAAQLDQGLLSQAGLAHFGHDGSHYGVDLLGSAWPHTDNEHQALMHLEQPQYDWSLSSLPTPDSALTQWPILTDTHAPRPPAPSSVPRLGDIEASTIASDTDPSLSSGRRTGRGDFEAQTTPATTPASSRREYGHANQPLELLIRQDSAKTRHLVDVFFAEIHPYWPIMHATTFEPDNASDLLLGAILMLSSWVTEGQSHVEIAAVVLRDVVAALGPEPTPSLHTLQALLLCIVYAICCRSEQGMLAKAVRLNALLVSTCRCLDIFSGNHVLPERMEECAFTFWLAKEQLRRLAFSVLRIDTYLSVLLDHPPSARYQELCIPLPKSSQLWTAASEEERRKLQWDEPAGREKALFSCLMRDALVDNGSGENRPRVPYRLSRMDFHLGLCALQSGVWEAAREAHSAASDEIVTKLEPGPNAPIDAWRSHLQRWCLKMVEDCHLDERDPFPPVPATPSPTTDPDASLTPLTVTLWHVSVIKMHAPLDILRAHGSAALLLNPAMASVHKPKARLRLWMASRCARASVWSAAQIAHLVASTVQDASLSATTSSRRRRLLLSNPLAIPALLMSAIAVCAYASQASACPACCSTSLSATSGLALGGIDLFKAELNDPELVAWRDRGEGWAVWDADRSRIPVCRCRLGALGEWFLGMLPGDYEARGELEGFLNGLNG